MSQIKKNPFEKQVQSSEKLNSQQFSHNKFLSQKYNNPNLSDSSKSSKKDLESSKDGDDGKQENISVSSSVDDDSEVSISNKSEILNNLNDESDELSHKKSFYYIKNVVKNKKFIIIKYS